MMSARSALRTASLTAMLLLSGCGASPPQAATSPTPAPTREVAAAPEAAPAGPDGEAVEKCFATANASRARFSGEPEKITVKHVLVKHQGSKNADPNITRSRGEACLRAIEARDKMREGADWAEVVKQYSDEPGAATREGSIGAVERKDVAKPFADAAFELGVNQLSDVVETESGFHVIFRAQ